MKRLLPWIPGSILFLWSFGALWFDAFPAAAWGFLLATLGAVILRGIHRAWPVPLVGFAIVLTWWLSLRPSNNRHWQEDVSRTPWCERADNRLLFHDLRAYDYPRNKKAIPGWETLTYNLDELEGMDLAVNYWGSPWIAHPIIVFRFQNSPPLAFSIETRREQGEEYSAMAGLFRKYELIVIAGGERDLLRVRTGHRKGEDVYLYSLTVPPEKARKRLLEYVDLINSLRGTPRWYNALTANCTTAILSIRKDVPLSADWRILLNGKMDRMFYELGYLKTDGLPFESLKARALVNPAAVEAHENPDFSEAIREGRPGFETHRPAASLLQESLGSMPANGRTTPAP